MTLVLQQILSLVIAQRRRIIEEVDGDSEKNPEAAEDEQSQLEDDEELKARTEAKGASAEALAKITDYCACSMFFTCLSFHSLVPFGVIAGR